MMEGMPKPKDKRLPEPQSQQSRNKAATRKNWSKVEDYLTRVERSHGFDKAWKLRQQLESGEITLDELTR